MSATLSVHWGDGSVDCAAELKRGINSSVYSFQGPDRTVLFEDSAVRKLVLLRFEISRPDADQRQREVGGHSLPSLWF